MFKYSKECYKGEIKKYILEHYKKIEEFGDKVWPLAFKKWYFMVDNAFDENRHPHPLFNEIYGELEAELGIINDTLPFFQT